MDEKSFFRAVKNGDLQAVLVALAENPQLAHIRDGDRSTPLHYASWRNHPAVAAALLDAGADIQAHNENSHWGTTPLHAAAHGDNKEAAQLLIERGADVNAVKANGEGTPLAETRIHNATAVAKLLRAAGAVE